MVQSLMRANRMCLGSCTVGEQVACWHSGVLGQDGGRSRGADSGIDDGVGSDASLDNDLAAEMGRTRQQQPNDRAHRGTTRVLERPWWLAPGRRTVPARVKRYKERLA